jgi:hypothetical protein
LPESFPKMGFCYRLKSSAIALE